MAHPIEISAVIRDELAGGEKGLLRLVVAVRKSLGRFEKGDLCEVVKSALHKLIASEIVMDVDGLYSLSPLAKRNHSLVMKKELTTQGE